MKIELTKEQQQMIGVAVLMLGGFGYAYYQFFWAPTAQKIADTRIEIEKIEADLAKAKSRADTLEGLKLKIEQLNQQIIDAEKRLPRKKEVASIVDTLNDLGKASRINLLTITPGPTTTQQYFVEVPYMISLEGTYHAVARFLAALAISERIFNQRSVSLSAKSASDSIYTLQSNFTLIAYQYREGGAAPSAQKGSPAKK